MATRRYGNAQVDDNLYSDDDWDEFQRSLQAALRRRANEEGFLQGQWVILERVISRAMADVYAKAHLEIRTEIHRKK